jgi:hypothetical protein
LATRVLRADGSEIPVELTSTTLQRDDLRHFRIITVLHRTVLHRLDTPPATVHIAGKIKLIGLDEVKEALGPRWSAMAARAMSSAEHVIRSRCGSHDTWSRTADGGFLIYFATDTEDEAAFRASAMAREIRTRLIGEGETEATATVSAIAAAVDVPHVPGRSPDMLATVIGERLNSRLPRSRRVPATRCVARWMIRQAADWNRYAIGVAAASPRILRVCARARAADPLRLFDAADERTAERRFRSSGTRRRSEPGDQRYRRRWRVAGPGDVDFEMFLDRRRTERYVAACQALDGRLKERLILVLSGLPKGVPKSRVLDCVMRLRPFCRGMGFQSDNMEAPLVELSLLAAAIVVLQDTRAPVDTARLAKAVDGLHAYQGRVLVRHVTSWMAAKPLAQLGVDLVSVIQDVRDAES